MTCGTGLEGVVPHACVSTWGACVPMCNALLQRLNPSAPLDPLPVPSAFPSHLYMICNLAKCIISSSTSSSQRALDSQVILPQLCCVILLLSQLICPPSPSYPSEKKCESGDMGLGDQPFFFPFWDGHFDPLGMADMGNGRISYWLKACIDCIDISTFFFSWFSFTRRRGATFDMFGCLRQFPPSGHRMQGKTSVVLFVALASSSKLELMFGCLQEVFFRWTKVKQQFGCLHQESAAAMFVIVNLISCYFLLLLKYRPN